MTKEEFKIENFEDCITRNGYVDGFRACKKCCYNNAGYCDLNSKWCTNARIVCSIIHKLDNKAIKIRKELAGDK